MDAVITYVNGLDPVWQQSYAAFFGEDLLQKRFRDWGTLKYLLRGIETYLPFVERVYLVVSGESQVPEWVNREHLHIVLHEDIIPEEYLPVFSSNPIEMCLHRIPGLSEEYVYFNDDCFPVAPCEPTDFFEGGRAVLLPSTQRLCYGMFRHIVRNSDHLARRGAGLLPERSYIRPQHTCTPMLRSACEELFESQNEAIMEIVSHRRRTDTDCAQYLYTDYMYYTGRTIGRRMSNKHFSLALATPSKMSSYICNPSRKIVCINDTRISAERYASVREALLTAFELRLPGKSRFEL